MFFFDSNIRQSNQLLPKISCQSLLMGNLRNEITLNIFVFQYVTFYIHHLLSKVKFIASILKNKYNISKYINNTEIIHYTYNDKMKDYENMSFDDIITNLSYDTVLLKVSDVYTSKFLGDIAFVILNQIIQNDLIIKTCQHCGRYFIPNKSNEIYCDRVYEDGRTCRELGALKTYKENLETNPGLLEYRRIYNKKSNRISRNKEDKSLKKEFNIWKKNAQNEIKKFKKGGITEKELYEWMMKNE